MGNADRDQKHPLPPPRGVLAADDTVGVAPLVDRIRALLTARLSDAAIGRILGMSHYAVRRLRKRHTLAPGIRAPLPAAATHGQPSPARLCDALGGAAAHRAGGLIVPRYLPMLEIVSRLACGESNRRIAADLGVTKDFVQRIRTKWQLDPVNIRITLERRVEAECIAYLNGVFEPVAAGDRRLEGRAIFDLAFDLVRPGGRYAPFGPPMDR